MQYKVEFFDKNGKLMEVMYLSPDAFWVTLETIKDLHAERINVTEEGL